MDRTTASFEIDDPFFWLDTVCFSPAYYKSKSRKRRKRLVYVLLFVSCVPFSLSREAHAVFFFFSQKKTQQSSSKDTIIFPKKPKKKKNLNPPP